MICQRPLFPISPLFDEPRRGALPQALRWTLLGLVSLGQLATLAWYLYTLPLLDKPFPSPLTALAESGIYLMGMMLLKAVQQLNFLPYTYSLLMVGLGFSLEASLIDMLDEVLTMPFWLSTAGASWLRMLGLFLLALGLLRLARQLRGQMNRLHELATLDELTGLSNRRHLQTLAQRWLQPGGRGLTLVMFDIDYFKQVNDRFGHSVGDRTLQDVARLVGAGLPPGAVLGRLGGEEFAILLPGRDADWGRQVAEARRLALAAGTTAAGSVTASFGVASQGPGETAFDALLHRADEALYDAKSAGRNCVCVVEPLSLRSC
ncbi:GGDEF domain-containing protein [Crenobacter sp. SG2305]|uniref:GGDEF domain-containing protein n=1 Tax=Crenobacter oryzisoli TaxID=3056844 RepID=UPI0025AA92B5|nr:GGDEF domain-containing protein [Crenobacter sp. SG2305]MDN0081145.1 GGDEF domain-containing protein [Crenobacter sp. SG2305]